ncbi:MAG TPA: class I SAM-dependent methyltransferase [Candidatus Sulfotelmatobacter sp.]|nr:class I SAM-dependent methyltransferase [Candidatus Sulfotelmatobacter sp.]
MTNPSDFQRESYRIDEQIWDAMALRSGERVLFLGLPNDGAWIARALEIGVKADVLSADDETLTRVEKLGAGAIRGSATMIPAGEAAYDAAVAMHYLHEIDPGFHGQVLTELARVAKRVVLIEPSPPADPLGRRIAALYGRAKREAGLFEAYQPIDYWRKLMALVKGDVWQSLLTFTRIPPKHAVAQTVDLVLEAMAIEEMPESYLDELRDLAARPDAQLLPLSRIVLVGTGAGEVPPQGAVEPFRPGVELVPPAPPAPPPAAPAIAAAPPQRTLPPPRTISPESIVQATDEPFTGFPLSTLRQEQPAAPASTPAAGKPTPPPKAPPAPKPPPVPTPPPVPAGQPGTPFGAPFALPGEDEDLDEDAPFGGGAPPPKDGFGWAWEPPENES